MRHSDAAAKRTPSAIFARTDIGASRFPFLRINRETEMLDG
jgi:hypothetical protein